MSAEARGAGRVALVHDYLTQYGGAERVLEALHALWPAAPIFTTFYDAARMRHFGFTVPPSSIHPLLPSWLPHRGRGGKLWTPLYPLLWSALDLGAYDLVISSSSFAAHQVRVSGHTRHLCYCHTPPRFLYGLATETDHARLRAALPMARPLYPALRALDRAAARRVSAYIANSAEVRSRILRFYGRDATIIHPPVETAAFARVEGRPGEYFLTWGRLVAAKRVDLLILAANEARAPLVVAGSGPVEGRLRALAGPTVRFAGHPNEEALRALLAGCRAVLFAAEEDFGIVPVEAMAAGKPVLAYAAGGALETVLPGLTGEFFAPQTSAALAPLIAQFDAARYDPALSRAQAARFDTSVFRVRMRACAADACAGGIARFDAIG